MNKKKVLYLITKSNWGGAQRYVYDLATNIDKNNFEVVVALGGDGPLVEMLQNARIKTILLTEMKNTTSVKQVWRAGRELYTILKTEKPDVFHLNSSIAGLVGAIVGRIARIQKIIFTAHGWAFNEDRSFFQRLIIKTLHYLTVMFSTRTIAVSNAIVNQMNWPGAQSKMKVINPGRTIGAMYDRTEARNKMIAFYPALLPYQSDQWVVCIAELHPIKRHNILVEAMVSLVKTYPKLRLILIGEGNERKKIEDKIKEKKLSENVFLTGNILEAARFLKAFDIFILASKSESYGYVLHEAGLAGLPVIATNVGGIPDIIQHNVNGLLIPPDNTQLLERAIGLLYGDKQLSEKFSSSLKNKMLERNINKMVRQILFLY